MIEVGIAGASGYAGGELFRLLLQHPEVEIKIITSKQHSGEYIFKAHPNLKGLTNLTFVDMSPMEIASKVDVMFLALPHGSSNKIMPEILDLGTRVIDLSADFRLHNSEDYPLWYGWEHSSPDLLDKFVYGLPELHRDEIRNSKNVAVPGCIASSAIYSLAPLAKSGLIHDHVVVDGKIGSSGSGNKSSISTNYSERYNSVRVYSPVGHRHTGEIEQELYLASGTQVKVAMSAHAVNMVRGILTTSSVFTDLLVEETHLWKAYRSMYGSEQFIRFMMNSDGIFRYPDPKLVIGSNFADLGFAVDRHAHRIVGIGAIDNLIKGTAGNAIQCMNIMMGFRETESLMSAPMRLI